MRSGHINIANVLKHSRKLSQSTGFIQRIAQSGVCSRRADKVCDRGADPCRRLGDGLHVAVVRFLCRACNNPELGHSIVQLDGGFYHLADCPNPGHHHPCDAEPGAKLLRKSTNPLAECSCILSCGADSLRRIFELRCNFGQRLSDLRRSKCLIGIPKFLQAANVIIERRIIGPGLPVLGRRPILLGIPNLHEGGIDLSIQVILCNRRRSSTIRCIRLLLGGVLSGPTSLSPRICSLRRGPGCTLCCRPLLIDALNVSADSCTLSFDLSTILACNRRFRSTNLLNLYRPLLILCSDFRNTCPLIIRGSRLRQVVNRLLDGVFLPAKSLHLDFELGNLTGRIGRRSTCILQVLLDFANSFGRNGNFCSSRKSKCIDDGAELLLKIRDCTCTQLEVGNLNRELTALTNLVQLFLKLAAPGFLPPGIGVNADFDLERVFV